MMNTSFCFVFVLSLINQLQKVCKNTETHTLVEEEVAKQNKLLHFTVDTTIESADYNSLTFLIKNRWKLITIQCVLKHKKQKMFDYLGVWKNELIVIEQTCTIRKVNHLIKNFVAKHQIESNNNNSIFIFSPFFKPSKN